ncbi:Single-stranded DNA-binding protein rim1, mitochondrial [Psilocybe cubensis]|uniref:Uncharacterized protein n=2 Tax=Psilocybe cubensis TaxID=181762 RepID=A0A8H7Y207_PSICU|nr:Single-stranded DNA-binding protein rim1, mitochondrial [Psilocybe cubensis]KAH9482960.1 Single-stranded DNA-binding protein rim1, mitochondrial [Psilocybe cubensis]
MLSAIRVSAARSFTARSFSSSSRASDLSKLTLIGNLARDPEARLTKNDKEYITYTVAVRNSGPPPGPDGERTRGSTTYHRVLSFNDGSNKYLRTLKKGSRIYCETTFELKEPAPDADPSTPQGQRQIFLRHESLKVISTPKPQEHSEESTEDRSFV